MNRNFRLLWASTGASNLADGILLVALPLLALATGASAAETAVVAVTITLAWPFLGLHAGWIVDRYPPRVILLLGNLARAAAVGALAVAVLTGNVPLWAIYAVGLAYGIGETLVDTALNSTVPRVVEPALRSAANGRIEATLNITNDLGGPALAGLLVGIGFVLTLGVSTVAYALAAGLAVAIALATTKTARDARQPLRLRDGITAIWTHRGLRTVTLLTALNNTAQSAWSAVFVVYAVRPSGLDLTPAGYGLLLSGAAAGGILASLFVGPLLRRFGMKRLLAVGVAGSIVAIAPTVFGAPLWVVATGVVLHSAGSALWRILAASYRQQELAPEVLGRGYAASRVVSKGAVPTGAGLAAITAGLWGVQAAFVAALAVAVIALLWFVLAVPRSNIGLRD